MPETLKPRPTWEQWERVFDALNLPPISRANDLGTITTAQYVATSPEEPCERSTK